MLKTSLLEILRTFTKQEMIKFEDFVRSPYFNKKENVIKLFLAIKKYAPAFEDGNLEKEKVWSKLFPEEKYNYGIMKNLIHDLNKLAEKFIRLEYSEKNGIKKDHVLLEILFERNILNLLSRKFLIFEKNYTDENLKNLDLESEEIYYTLYNAFGLKGWCDFSFDSDSNYRENQLHSSKYLLFGFLIHCFKSFHNNRARNISKHSTEDEDLIEIFFRKFGHAEIEYLLNYARKDSPGSYPVLKCFYLMYKTISSDKNVENYLEFKNALINYGDILSSRNLLDLYVCILSSVQNLKSPDIDVNNEFCELYKLMMSKNIFLEPNGMLREYRFNLYIHYSCRLDTYEETVNFISDYLDKIPESSRESSYNFAMAHIHFVRSEFGKSLEYVSKINENYFDMKHQLKNLMLMIYYELNDYDSFLYSLDTTRHFINKNKSIDNSSKETNNIFLNFINRLFKIKISHDTYELRNLEIEINNSYTPQKPWLNKELNLLKVKK